MDKAHHSIKTIAMRAADAARCVTLRYFRQPLDIDSKGVCGFDPVTRADKNAELAMRDVVSMHRPDDGIVGEEITPKDGISGIRWVLDPIDGTRAYIAGMPTWGTLIGVCDHTGPVAGLIDHPYTGERFWGGFGHAYMDGPNGKIALSPKQNTRLADAIMLTTFPEVGCANDRAGFEAVANQVRLVRYGSDCYGYALVALGAADVVIEAGLHPYDIVAPMAVVQNAGGIVTNWRGGDAAAGGQVVAAANGQIHAQILDILKPFADG